jgi:formylglycine-generating enzyme
MTYTPHILAFISITSLIGCVEGLELDGTPCPCTEGWTCCPVTNVCARESSQCPGWCGNGIVDENEVCDSGDDNRNEYSLNKTCSTTCDGFAPHCGDGEIQQNMPLDASYEGCDPGSEDHPITETLCSELHPMLGDGTTKCMSNCIGYDTSTCSNQDVTFVPAGPFMMGCDPENDLDCNPKDTVDYVRESPMHKVILSAYIIDKNEVTVAAYLECVEAGICEYTGPITDDDPNFLDPDTRYFQTGYDDYPVNFTLWAESQAYCEYRGMRLPTEAQWEKAARGPDSRIFPWGSSLPNCDLAIIRNSTGPGCGENRAWPVGSRTAGAGPYGNLDMAGNLWEWVHDWGGPDYYQESPLHDPQGPDSSEFGMRIVRGGSWGTQILSTVRAALRFGNFPDFHNGYLGFRCASSVQESSK